MLFHAIVKTRLAVTEKISDPMNGFNRLSRQFALPYHQNPPAKAIELPDHSAVSFDICVEFSLPEIDMALGRARVFASRMPVPITSVNEDRRMELGKYNIRAAR